MKSAHFEELGRRDRDYWWFRTRYALALRLLRRFHGPTARHGLLDFGCGTGGFLHRAVAEGFVSRERALGIDGDATAIDRVRASGLPGLQAKAESFGRDPLPFHPDVVTSLDVLEHLDDPVALLASLATRVARPATLVVLVPAMPSLWSEWDERLAHRRRYGRRTLATHLREAGWTPQRLQYVFPSMVGPALLRRSFGLSASNDEFPEVHPAVDRVLGAVTGIEAHLPWWPCGTSLAGVATLNPAGRESPPDSTS